MSAVTPNTFKTFTAWGWREMSDPIAKQSQDFAAKLADVRCIRAVMYPDASDAKAVNDAIKMIAAQASALIDALIADAEAHGLESSGDWIGDPVREVQAFEVPSRGAA